MYACSHHAKPGVTQTTQQAGIFLIPSENAGLQESDGAADAIRD
jgi:hypothetical protein